MINDPLLRQFSEKTDDEFIFRLIIAYDKKRQEKSLEDENSVLLETLEILKETIDENKKNEV